MSGPVGPILPVGPTRPAGLAPAASGAPGAAGSGSFGNLLSGLLSGVQTSQAQVQAAELQVVTGQAPDLAQVMLTSEQATLALELTTQVRNKVLEAYQDLMKMPL